jgi:hypothetical protein
MLGETCFTQMEFYVVVSSIFLNHIWYTFLLPGSALNICNACSVGTHISEAHRTPTFRPCLWRWMQYILLKTCNPLPHHTNSFLKSAVVLFATMREPQCAIHRSPPLVSIPSHTESTHSLNILDPFEYHFPSMNRPPKWYLPFRLSHLVCMSCISHVCYMSKYSHSSFYFKENMMDNCE